MTSKQPHSSTRDLAAADLLYDAIEALAEGIAVFDIDRKLVTHNQKFAKLFPLVEDLIAPGVVWRDLLIAGAKRGQFADALPNPELWIDNRLNDEFPLNQTIETELANGVICQAQFSATSLGGFVVVCSDVTQRRKTEAAVREQENILRTVLETSPLAVVMARLVDGKILYRSPEAVSFFGNTQNALQHYVDPNDRNQYIDALVRNGRVDDYHITLVNAQGISCASTSWGRLVSFEGDEYVVTAIMDLSERQEREAMIRRVLEACPTPIQMTRAASGEVMFSSPETITLFGPSDTAKRFYARPGTRKRYLEQLRRDGFVNEFKAEYLNAKNEMFWGAVSARLIDYNGEQVIVSHTRDLTDQIQIEEELSRQQEQLYQNEKLLAMGELLAGVAHELNNPLSVVVGHSLMLREDCADPETLRQVEKISNAAERCARIVKTFLTMARQKPAKMQDLDINEVLQTAVDVAKYGDIEDGISVSYQLAQDLPMISADPDQITQVFINMILNAEQAMRESGKGQQITVKTQKAPDQSGVMITVEDDGPGIPEKSRGRVFEPFFTTREVGQGTGMGLAICHRIIQSHNGQISIETGANGGSLFQILLPLNSPNAQTPADIPKGETTAPDIRILIVDDEEDVAELNAEILSRSGYQVDVFTHADDALESLRTHNYGLILSDLNMPDVDGRGFFDAITQEFPAMIDKTGFITGDTMGHSSQSFLAIANRPYVEKPLSPKELRTFVTDILAKAEQVNR
ncbi:ATP-binding protein [Aliiroseovarius sp. KMU-50]|uniref:histidine kinase n=1 Tax=Aliiroseovarius salicola TaxID=3009082 RepID=A0ABT4W5L1_9RHOB|nr:ATP-binding protein [Aliiroseovarius sp. KMU-50]MDA5095813.1 ATP-binding protein [Aliiroseovarius sp. KMU-50]